MHIFSPTRRMARHYKREADHFLIELHLSEARRLFNSLDPAPFIEKDIDNDAEAFIVDMVQGFPLATQLKLVVHLPAGECDNEHARAIPEAIRNYFDYRAHHAEMGLRFMLLQGRASLLIGLLFLFGCITVRQLIAGLDAGLMHDILSEGLLICGWVAMWRPIQIYLYDWWPIRRMCRIYEKIREMPVRISPLA